MDHTGLAPDHKLRVLSQATLLRLQDALQGCCPKQALRRVHFPGLSCSGSGSRVLHKSQTQLGICFVPFPGLSSSGNQVLGKCTVPGGLCILITSPVLAPWFPGCVVCLLWGADLRLQPSWQMSTIQDPRETWLATGSLLTLWWRMPSLAWRIPGMEEPGRLPSVGSHRVGHD